MSNLCRECRLHVVTDGRLYTDPATPRTSELLAVFAGKQEPDGSFVHFDCAREIDVLFCFDHPDVELDPLGNCSQCGGIVGTSLKVARAVYVDPKIRREERKWQELEDNRRSV